MSICYHLPSPTQLHVISYTCPLQWMLPLRCQAALPPLSRFGSVPKNIVLSFYTSSYNTAASTLLPFSSTVTLSAHNLFQSLCLHSYHKGALHNCRSQRWLSRGGSITNARPVGTTDGSPIPERISSTSNSYVKHCVKLRTSNKYRTEARAFLLVGTELLKEAAGDGTLNVNVLCLLEDAKDDVISSLLPCIQAHRMLHVTEAVMKKLAGLENVDNVGAVAELQLPPSADFVRPGVRVQRLLALDRIQDPGNMGTLLRTAIAFGWDGVFLLPGCGSPFSDKAVRASRGAALRLPIASGTLADLQQVVRAHNMVMVAAEPEAPALDVNAAASHQGSSSGSSGSGPANIAKAHGTDRTHRNGLVQGHDSSSTAAAMAAAATEQLAAAGGAVLERSAQLKQQHQSQQPAGAGAGAVCLVLGSEGQGVAQEVLDVCLPLGIPMAGDMESLNVGVAGGVLMFLMSPGAFQLVQRLLP